MQVGGTKALPEATGVEVDLHRAGARIEVTALGGVVPETGTDADHQVGFDEALSSVVAGERAGDAEVVRVVLEETLPEE